MSGHPAGPLCGLADLLDWDAGITALHTNPITVHRIMHECGIDPSPIPTPWNYIVGPMMWDDNVLFWVPRGLYHVALAILESNEIEAE